MLASWRREGIPVHCLRIARHVCGSTQPPLFGGKAQENGEHAFHFFRELHGSGTTSVYGGFTSRCPGANRMELDQKTVRVFQNVQ